MVPAPGLSRPASAPTWTARMEPGRWYRLSGDSPDLGLAATAVRTRYLRDGDPARDPKLNPVRNLRDGLKRLLGGSPAAPWSGRCGFSAITEAWNSAVFASRFGVAGSMIVFGGGHDDYFGSDVHAFDLAEREWARISNGFVTGGPAQYGAGAVYPDAVYPDGSPVPPHTYDYAQYDATGNDYILMKGNIELGPDVKAIAIPHLFNLDTLTWRQGPRHPRAVLNSGGWTTWDAKRRVIWGHSGDEGGGNAFTSFCPDGAHENGGFGSWGMLYPNKLPGEASNNAMQIDPVRDLIVVAIHSRDALGAIDPQNPAAALVRLRSTGPRPVLRSYAALEFAPSLDRFVYYSAHNGPTLYSIEAPKGGTFTELVGGVWLWRTESRSDDFDPVADASAVTAFPANIGHTFGRFRVASYASCDLAVLLRHVDSPVYALRLS